MLGTKPETKFTPGPWRIEGSQVWSANNSCITDRIFNGEANAKLIAAVPELLEAAQAVGDYLAFMVAVGNSKYPVKLSPEGEQKLKAMRDAIRKAVA